MAIDDTGTDLWTVAWAWKSWKVVESRFERESSTFFLKVEETTVLLPEESARAGTPLTCHDHVEPMQYIRTPNLSITHKFQTSKIHTISKI